MNIKKCDIITLDDNTRYTVTEILDYNNSKYVHLVAVDENEDLLEEMSIARMEEDGNGGYELVDIEDEKEFEEVKKLIIEMFENDYPEEE